MIASRHPELKHPAHAWQPAERCLINIDEVGNTAAASIPLALAHGMECEALRPGHLVALTAFGGGLTWGSALLRWPKITYES